MPALNHPVWGREQYSLATLDQLRHHYSESQIRTMTRDGTIVWAQPRVAAFTVGSDSAERRLMAALLSARPAAASHRSAAWLWDLAETAPRTPEIVVTPDRRPRLRNVIVHRSIDVDSDAVMAVRGITVTSPLLTVLHLGGVAAPVDVQRAVNRAIAKRLFSIDELRSYLEERGRSGKNGAAVLREVVALMQRGGPLESELERRFLDLCRRHGLPEPEFQVRVVLSPTWTIRIDVAWPEIGLAVELDGFFIHGHPEAAERDQLRQLKLNELGWHVERFTWVMIAKHPEQVATRLHQLIRTLSGRL